MIANPHIGPRLFLRHLRAAAAMAVQAAPMATVLYAALALVSAAIPVLAAWVVRLLFDRITHAGDVVVATLLPVAAAVAALGLLSAVLPEARGYLQGQLSRAIGVLAMDRLYRAVGRLVGIGRIEDPGFRDRFRMAHHAARAGPSQVVNDVLGATQAAVTMVGFLGTLLLLSPAMAAVVLCGAVPALLAQLRLSRAGAAMIAQLTSRARREFHYGDLLTGVPAAKEVRLLRLGDLFRGRMLGELTAVNAGEAAHARRQLTTEGNLMLLAALISGGGLIWAVYAAAHGQLTAGDVSVFIAAVAGVQSGAQTVVERMGTAHRAMLLFHHFRYIETTVPDLPLAATPTPLGPLRGGIELTDVWFRYQDDKPWVLRGVNLFIPNGRAVALVGLNGAGKSTLIKLLCRFYDPTRGSIRWDGIDLRDVSADELRGRIGAVFQDYMRYELTVAENIGVGDLVALNDRPRITAATARAGAHEMVTALPRGYDTLLSNMFFDEADRDNPETGVMLSGGQSQRVALARAFMRDRRDLLILDEPSAGLDAEAEHEIQTRLRRYRGVATSLLISHRLGVVRDADLIVVLADGRVVEQGTHDELMASGRGYARLFTLQSRGYLAAGEVSAAPQVSSLDSS